MKLIRELSDAKSMINAADTSGYLMALQGDLLRELQLTLLDMILDVLKVCRSHGIPIFLAGGTALGAVRHQGFIPWDDDVDLCMTREAFRQFIPVFEEELSDRYILNAPNYSDDAISRFPKILKRDSYLDTGEAKDPALRRVFLDVFLADPVPDNPLERAIKGLHCNIAEFVAGQVKIVENRNSISKRLYQSGGKANYYIRYIIGTVFSFRSAANWHNRIDQMVQYCRTDVREYGLLTGSKHYFGEIFPKEMFSEARTGQFEAHSVPLLHNVEDYLTNLYGDYMEIPPPEKRQKHFIREIRLSDNS